VEAQRQRRAPPPVLLGVATLALPALGRALEATRGVRAAAGAATEGVAAFVLVVAALASCQDEAAWVAGRLGLATAG
jgi:hypothetical protein